MPDYFIVWFYDLILHIITWRSISCFLTSTYYSMCECTILLKTYLLCLTSRFLWFSCNHMQCYSEYSCCSVTQRCPALCNPMECSTPGFPVLHHIPEFAHTLVHWVSDAIQPSYHLSPPSPPVLNLPQHQSLFQWVSSSHQVAQGLELQLQHPSFWWIFRADCL